MDLMFINLRKVASLSFLELIYLLIKVYWATQMQMLVFMLWLMQFLVLYLQGDIGEHFPPTEKMEE